MQKLPPDVAELTVLKSSQLDAAQKAFNVLENLPVVLGIFLVLLFAAAIGLSPDRRRTILSCGLRLVIAGIAVLAVRKVGGNLVVDALADAPNAHAAAPDVWAIATSLLVDAAEGALLLGFLLVLGAWFSGPGRRAVSLRRRAAPSFRDHPAVVHGTLAVLLLLLIWWGPVPWTHNPVALVIVAIVAFALAGMAAPAHGRGVPGRGSGRVGPAMAPGPAGAAARAAGQAARGRRPLAGGVRREKAALV